MKERSVPHTHVALATRLCRNLHFQLNQTRGRKIDPARQTAGGGGLTAIPLLQRFGVQVEALGRYTADDEPARDFLVAAGAHWSMHKVPGNGAVNASAPVIAAYGRDFYVGWIESPTAVSGTAKIARLVPGGEPAMSTVWSNFSTGESSSPTTGDSVRWLFDMARPPLASSSCRFTLCLPAHASNTRSKRS